MLVQGKRTYWYNYKKLWKDIKKHKLLYFTILPLIILLFSIYSYGLPDIYMCTVKLATVYDEQAKKPSSLKARRLLKNLMGNNVSSQSDAFTPALYPDLMNSVEFRKKLLSIRVKPFNLEKEITFADYLLNYQTLPWWYRYMGMTPGKALLNPDSIDTFQMNRGQFDLVTSLGNIVVGTFDAESFTINIDVIAQDPMVAAVVADSASSQLQRSISNYHIKKAQNDYSYYEKMREEVKEKYDSASALYAKFVDSNRDVTTRKTIEKAHYLEYEKELLQEFYLTLSNNYFESEAKILQETPAFTVLQRPTAPVEPFGPDRLSMVLYYLFISILVITFYIFYKEGDVREIVGLE